MSVQYEPFIKYKRRKLKLYLLASQVFAKLVRHPFVKWKNTNFFFTPQTPRLKNRCHHWPKNWFLEVIVVKEKLKLQVVNYIKTTTYLNICKIICQNVFFSLLVWTTVLNGSSNLGTGPDPQNRTKRPDLCLIKTLKIFLKPKTGPVPTYWEPQSELTNEKYFTENRSNCF